MLGGVGRAPLCRSRSLPAHAMRRPSPGRVRNSSSTARALSISPIAPRRARLEHGFNEYLLTSLQLGAAAKAPAPHPCMLRSRPLRCCGVFPCALLCRAIILAERPHTRLLGARHPKRLAAIGTVLLATDLCTGMCTASDVHELGLKRTRARAHTPVTRVGGERQRVRVWCGYRKAYAHENTATATSVQNETQTA